MTNEEQRLAIANVCGWYKINWSGMFVWQQAADTGTRRGNCPDYLKDLNAMHEAEKLLTHADKETYVGLLCDLIDKDDEDAGEYSCYSLAHAPASRRGEAFLRTLGLWNTDDADVRPNTRISGGDSTTL